MFTVLLVLQVLMGIAIIGLVLLQQGKGADMGAAFGAGASGTVFGAGGGGSFFTRVTAVLATLFFANSLLLSSPLVREVPDAGRSVTQTVTMPAPATEESDVPPVDEELVVEEIDVPPADLPEVAEQPEAAEVAEPDQPAAAEEAPADPEPAATDSKSE